LRFKNQNKILLHISLIFSTISAVNNLSSIKVKRKAGTKNAYEVNEISMIELQVENFQPIKKMS